MGCGVETSLCNPRAAALTGGRVWRRGFFLFPARNWVYAHAYGGLPTMMPDALGALNQQFQQGCYVAQQAAMAEQMGNVFAACQH